MQLDLVASFQGDDAEDHMVPAYEGTKSLIGISRAFVVINHYLVTGKVRRRAPFTEDVHVYMRPPREGSFEALYSFISANPEVLALGAGAAGGAGAVAVNVTSTLLSDAVKLLLRRVTGRGGAPETEALEEIERERPGDIDALTDAIEPAMRYGHTVIGQGCQNIVIVQGSDNVVTFDSVTKEYVNRSDVSDEGLQQDVSIGSFNVNSGYGRAWFDDLGKTVPFILAREHTARTVPSIARSLDNYAHKLPSNVSIQYRRVDAPDGRLKKVIIHDAYVDED